MEPLINQKKSAESKLSLPSLVQDLSANLNALKPANSETAQLITYALLATAVVGIMVYHYIKENEKIES